MQLTTRVSVELDDLIEAMDRDEAEAIIKAIDLGVADYEFTEQIAKYLIQVLADECKAGGEPFDLNALAPNAIIQGPRSGPAGMEG